MPKSKGNKALVQAIKKKKKAQVVQVSKAVKKWQPFQMGGRALGGFLGGALGDARSGRNLGSRLGAYVGRVTGMGDYTLSQNVFGLSGGAVEGAPPTFSKSGECCVIEHREFVGDLLSSSTPGSFKIEKFSVNPSNRSLFPWLSSFAASYDQWEPMGILVQFKSTSASWSGSGQALGTVIIASDYDVYDATYDSKVEMENTEFAVSTRSDGHILHPIECDPALRATKLLYCDELTGNDRRFNSLANVQIASVGINASSVNLGEIWVTYRIKFHKPQLVKPIGTSYSFASINSGAATDFLIGPVRNFFSLGTNAVNTTLRFENVASCTSRVFFDDPASWGHNYVITFSWFKSGGSTANTTTLSFTAGNYTSLVPIGPADTSIFTGTAPISGFNHIATVVKVGQGTGSGDLPFLTIGSALVGSIDWTTSGSIHLSELPLWKL